MKSLIHEIHRRSLWQVLGIYVGASWLLLQVVDTIAGALSLPDWSTSLALFLMIIGLPIVLATAFVQEGVTKRERGPASPSSTETDAAVAEAAAPVPHADTEAAGSRPLLTWRNAVFGGVGAFALLGVLSAGWVASRALGIGPAATLQARGIIDDQALVVLADFEAADSELAAAATEALRVDLSQSTAIRLADQALIADALERMERDPREALTADVARELARREGAGAVIQGEIRRAGDGYVFSAQLVSATDGATLTSQRETADGPGDVIAAIEGLSKRLRERIGESLGSIRAGEPLARVTTDNLEALELYSRAQRLRGIGDPRPFLERAVALDSGFAMAWSAIASDLRGAATERARMIMARTNAYEQRERLTPRERHLTSAMYFIDVLGEPDRAVGEFEAMLELDSLDARAINNLGLTYGELRRMDLAEPLFIKQTQLEPDAFAPGFWNVIQARVHLGKFAEAWETVDTAVARFPQSPAVILAPIVASNEGDFDRAEGLLRVLLLDMPPGVPREIQARTNGDLGAVLATRGRVAEASQQFDEAEAITRPLTPTDFWEDVIQHAWMEVAVRGRPEVALRDVADADSRMPLDSLPALDRPYAPLAELYARAGAVEEARSLMEELDRDIPPEYDVTIRAEVARAEGEIALAEGRFDDAIAEFKRSDFGFCTICALTGLGAAYDRAGQADSAIAVYTRYVETPFPDRYASYAYPLGPALGPAEERLGQLYDEVGDLENAVKYYAMFVELWADADEELQPRVRAAQARLEAILRERG